VRSFKSIFIFFVLIVSFAPQLAARMFYVSTSGVDGQSGAISAPWRTIGYATGVLRAGDTLYVRGGVYHEVLYPTQSGTAGAYIVFSAYPGEYVQIDGPLDGKHEVVTNWKSYIVIQGFTFKDQDFLHAPGLPTYWVSLYGSNVIFRNNRVIGEGNAYDNVFVANELSRGIVVGGHHLTVEHCFVRGLDFGILVTGGSPRNVILRYDTVFATTASNIDIQATGGITTAYHATLIEQCVLDTSWTEDNIQFENDYTIPTSTLYNRGTIVRNNRCGNAAENAIDLKGTEHIVIDNNILYSASGDDNGPLGGHDVTSGTGLVVKSPGVYTRRTLVRNNLIYDNASGAVMTEGDVYYNNTFLNNRRSWLGPNRPELLFFGIIAWSEAGADRMFINNIIAGQPNRAMLRFALDSTSGNFYLNNNMYYDSLGSARFYHRQSGPYIMTMGLPSWKTVLSTYSSYSYIGGKDAASIEADPQFLSAPIGPTGFTPSWDFGLRAASPAVDAGRFAAFAQNSGSSSTSLVVDNAYCFCDGFGITSGDLIRIGRGTQVQIVSIDYSANAITLAEPRTWTAGMGVHVAFGGNAPDVGARESAFAGTTPLSPWLSSPSDEATGLDTDVSLIWIAPPDANSYEVQVATTADFAAPFVTQSGITNTTHQLRGLTKGATCYWRVRATTSLGVSPWSDVFVFFIAQTTIPLQYNQGWNIVSIPLVPRDSSSSTLFPNAISQTFTYDRQYVGASTLSVGKGYWVRLPSTSMDTIRGMLVSSRNITVKKGWNLIGGLDSAVSTSGITTSPSGIISSSFFAYDRGYVVSTSLTGGKGYWVNVADSGVLHLFGSTAKPGVEASIVDNSWIQIEFEDAAGSHASLYLAADDHMPVHNLLPPVPPAGAFDVRFAGDHDVEVRGALHAVQLTSVAYPLRISARNAQGISMRVRDGVDGTLLNSPLEAGKVVVLERAIGAVTIDDGGVPTSFELMQNYPNPFNPSTEIGFRVSDFGIVTVRVFDLLGREVATLVNEQKEPGTHSVKWDASGMASGTYVYRLQAGSFVQSKKMILMK
jgi:hypothetical protein